MFSACLSIGRGRYPWPLVSGHFWGGGGGRGAPWPLVPGPFQQRGEEWVGTPGRTEVPPQSGQGVPPPPRHESECCYAAGGKPLAVTQEDFLVRNCFS